MFHVYSVRSNDNPWRYYGYVKSDEPANLLIDIISKAFETQSKRSEERKDVEFARLSNDHNFILEGSHQHELDALISRNKYRTTDRWSFTGPTLWPLSTRVSVNEADVKQWANAYKQRNTKCARESYMLGAWTFQEMMKIKQLVGAEQASADLNNLSYHQFNEKYFK